MLDTISLSVDDHNAKAQTVEICLKLKTLIDRNQHVKSSSRASREFCIREGSPFHFCDRLHLVMRERLANASVHAFI